MKLSPHNERRRGGMRMPPNETPRPRAPGGSALRGAQDQFDAAGAEMKRFLEEIRIRERANRFVGAGAIAFVAAAGGLAAVAADAGALAGPFAPAPVAVAALAACGALLSAPWHWSWHVGVGRHRLAFVGRDLADAEHDVRSVFDAACASLGLYEARSAQSLAAMHDAAREQLYQRGALEGLKHAEKDAAAREDLHVDLWRSKLFLWSLIGVGAAAASLFLR